jgi:GntR family transcriptional regulator
VNLRQFDLNLLVALDVLLAEGNVARAARRLRLSPGATVSRMQRLRTANGAPMALELAAIPTVFLPEPQVVTGSLYDALRARGYSPFRALQRLTAVRLTADQSAQLGVAEGAAALYVERRTMLEDGTPLEFVRSQYRGDAYDFIVELSLGGGRDGSRDGGR